MTDKEILFTVLTIIDEECDFEKDEDFASSIEDAIEDINGVSEKQANSMIKSIGMLMKNRFKLK